MGLEPAIAEYLKHHTTQLTDTQFYQQDSDT
jgi:hypothetical protein